MISSSVKVLIARCAMGIWSITRIVSLENGPVVIMLLVVVWIRIRREVCQRVLFMRRRLVWGLVVLVVMLLGVYCVVLLVVMVWVKGVVLLVFLIMPI